MSEKKKPDLTLLKEIKSPADFYGWKKAIVAALKEKENPLGPQIEKETSLLAVYQMKEQILRELGLNDN